MRPCYSFLLISFAHSLFYIYLRAQFGHKQRVTATSLLGAPEHSLGAGGEVVLVLDGGGWVCRENGLDGIRQAWVYGVSSFTTWDLLLYLLAFFLGRVLRGLG